MVELLLPAQNKKSVQAIITNIQKDSPLEMAIYFGVETFNMRMHARNIKLSDLKEFVAFCHENGLKAYMTTNILIFKNTFKTQRKLKNIYEKIRKIFG